MYSNNGVRLAVRITWDACVMTLQKGPKVQGEGGLRWGLAAAARAAWVNACRNEKLESFPYYPPCTLMGPTNTPGWQASSDTPDTLAHIVCHIFFNFTKRVKFEKKVTHRLCWCAAFLVALSSSTISTCGISCLHSRAREEANSSRVTVATLLSSNPLHKKRKSWKQPWSPPLILYYQSIQKCQDPLPRAAAAMWERKRICVKNSPLPKTLPIQMMKNQHRTITML